MTSTTESSFVSTSSSEPEATEASTTTVGSDEATTTVLASSFIDEEGEVDDKTEVEETSLPRFVYIS